MPGTIAMIAPRHPLVFAAAFGFPAVLITFGHGHNAFLTTALLGGGLFWLERRPALAGVCLGLLAYKPQFGIVLPLVVILGGHWRVAMSAAATIAAMVIIATLALGPQVWTAFADGAVFTRHVVLEQGGTGWYKIQSVFSAVRWFGGSVSLAYSVQVCVTVSLLMALATLIWARCDSRLTAAATAIATLLATPYCLDYDMVILAVAIAFSLRHGVDAGFAPFEKSLLALVWLTPLIARTGMLVTGIPLGVLVMITFFIFVVARALDGVAFKRPTLWSAVRG